MDRVPVTAAFGGLVRLQKRDIIRRRIVVDIFKPNVHRPHGDINLFHTREEEEQVMGSQGKEGSFRSM